jgi:hypothetical protein
MKRNSLCGCVEYIATISMMIRASGLAGAALPARQHNASPIVTGNISPGPTTVGRP